MTPLPTMAGAIAAAFVLVSCGGGGEEGTRAPVPREAFGVNAQVLQRLPTVDMHEELAVHLDSVANLGVDFVRTNLDWRIIEPRPPEGGRRHYDWATTDQRVEALATRGLRWQPTVMGSPTPLWAADVRALRRCGAGSPPRRPLDYGALLGALARRYGRDGTFWERRPELDPRPITAYEVWNEPNLELFWCPRPDPAAHARLYLAARRAVHAIDPAAIVLYGGLAHFPPPPGSGVEMLSAEAFLRRALAAEPQLRRRIDAVGIHPYRQTPEAAASAVVAFRVTLDRLGLGDAGIAVNEIGWVTSGRGGGPLASEEERAELLPGAVAAIAASRCDAISVAPHTWITPELDPENPEHWYGIADPATGEPYPTAEAYADVVSASTGGELLAGEAGCEASVDGRAVQGAALGPDASRLQRP